MAALLWLKSFTPFSSFLSIFSFGLRLTRVGRRVSARRFAQLGGSQRSLLSRTYFYILVPSCLLPLFFFSVYIQIPRHGIGFDFKHCWSRYYEEIQKCVMSGKDVLFWRGIGADVSSQISRYVLLNYTMKSQPNILYIPERRCLPQPRQWSFGFIYNIIFLQSWFLSALHFTWTSS